MTSRRPRKTRIYDANYRMGESTYKSALDDLDKKYAPKPLSSVLKDSIRLDLGDKDSSLYDARQRASRAITEETVFDSRGFKVPKAGISLSSAAQVSDSFDEDVEKTLEKLAARKKMIFEKERSLPSFRKRVEEDIAESIFDGKNVSESTNFCQKRALKVVAAAENVTDHRNLTKWTAIEKKSTNASDSLELSKKRALETKTRLREIEDDMFTRQEKQFARERHIASLKKSLNEDFDTNLAIAF